MSSTLPSISNRRFVIGFMNTRFRIEYMKTILIPLKIRLLIKFIFSIKNWKFGGPESHAAQFLFPYISDSLIVSRGNRTCAKTN